MSAHVAMDRDRLCITGNIDFHTVMNIWKDSLPLLKSLEKIIIDFSRVTFINSAALALLLEWLQYAKRQHKPIVFEHVPLQLQLIAEVVGIKKMMLDV